MTEPNTTLTAITGLVNRVGFVKFAGWGDERRVCNSGDTDENPQTIFRRARIGQTL